MLNIQTAGQCRVHGQISFNAAAARSAKSSAVFEISSTFWAVHRSCYKLRRWSLATHSLIPFAFQNENSTGSCC
jgi:hypothetical protein